MNIGEAAGASGVSPKMVRYYESIGLLPPARRSASGYREYDAGDVHRLRFVRRARDFGFSMAEIHDLLALRMDHSRSSKDVKQIALGHVAGLDGKIRELTALRDSLAHLAGACHGDGRPECPILDDLDGSSAPAGRHSALGAGKGLRA